MVPQQIGIWFIIRQQVQPACIIAFMQSQQLWIIWQHLGSPDMHIILQPLSVISIVHMPITRLHEQTIMPFIIMQQLTMPPDIMVHRFWSMLAAMASSQTQVMHMPVLVRSIFMVQRGNIMRLGGIAMPVLAPLIGFTMPAFIIGMPMPIRSIVMLAMIKLPFVEVRNPWGQPAPPRARRRAPAAPGPIVTRLPSAAYVFSAAP
jgi:hypothetical protein